MTTAVATFLATESVEVERMTKKGLRQFDCRGAVVALSAAPRESGSRLDLVLRHAVPAVRPDDVLSGLAAVAGLEVAGAPLLTRLAQGPLDAGDRGDRRPARVLGVDAVRPRRVRYSPWSTRTTGPE